MTLSPGELAVFVHIFKNSGTSVTQQLKKSCPDGQFTRENDGKIDGLGFVARMERALANPGLRVLAGHFRFSRVHKTLTDLGGPQARYFSFVREPISRAVSIYNYSRNLPKSRHHALAMGHDLDGFLRALLHENSQVLANHQTLCLSTDGSPRFDAARTAIEQHFAFVGLSEDIARTNEQSLATLGFGFDGSIRKNVSSGSAKVADISPDVLAELRAHNQEDARLYDFVAARLATSNAG